jgi:death on curing protein
LPNSRPNNNVGQVKEPIWIDKRDALALHDQLLTVYGGASGVRDEGLLDSALARSRQQFAYASPSIVEMAAAYISGIVQNHPFVDGNKRTGFVVGVLFLEMNGFTFTASEAEAAQAVLELAAGSIDETGFAAFLRDHGKRARKRP